MLVSMVVALTVTPALCLILLSRAQAPGISPAAGAQAWLRRGSCAHHPHPAPAIVTVAVVMLAGVVVAPTLGTILLPDFKERDFLMHWLAKPGTSQAEEFRISVRACKDLREIPGVRNCGSHIGQAFLADEPYGVDFGENWISVNPRSTMTRLWPPCQDTVDAYPGLYRDVQTYLRERVREVLTGTSEAIVVRIYGPDLDVLYAKADEISKEMQDIPGLIDAHADLQEDLPRGGRGGPRRGARLRHQAGRRAPAGSTLVASEEVGDIFKGGKAYDVHVEHARDSQQREQLAPASDRHARR